jgi:ankyrin repeat protein
MCGQHYVEHSFIA